MPEFKSYDYLIGKTYSQLTVIEILPAIPNKTRKCKVECSCGNVLEVRISNLLSGNTNTCGCTRGDKNRFDIAGNRYGRWTVISRVEDDSDRHTKWLCRCDCSTEKIVYQDNLIGGKSVSCGCYSIEQSVASVAYEMVGRRRGMLEVIKRLPNRGKVRRWLIKCDCGSEFESSTGDFLVRKTTNCGCIKGHKYKDMAGKVFGKLTAVCLVDDVVPATWECSCTCGGTIKVRASNLVSGNTRSCGCLDDRVNTKPVSQQQRKIHEMLGGVMNYKEGNFFIDIAILHGLHKIAVEYDSYYWHSKTTEREERKTKFLLENGWKLLRVKSVYKVPDSSILNDALNYFYYDLASYKEIVLPDWEYRKEMYG